MQRGRAAAVIGKGDVLEGNGGRGGDLLRLRFGRDGRGLALAVQDRLDTLLAGDGFGDGKDEIGEFDELDEDDGEIAVERDDVALQDKAAVHALRPHPDEDDGGDVDKGVGERVGDRRNAPRALLLLPEHGVALPELADLVLLLAEGAHDAHARKIFPCGEIDAVHPALYLFVERDTDGHDADDGCGEQRDDGDKDERRRPVHRERHDHRAEHDERRAQQQTQRHVDARLHLIDVARHAGDHGRRPHLVDARVRHGLELTKEPAAQLRRSPHRRLGGKELRRERKGKPRHAERGKDEDTRDDIRHVPVCDADVDDLRDDERDEKFHARLAQLKKRREDGFPAVCLQAGK